MSEPTLQPFHLEVGITLERNDRPYDEQTDGRDAVFPWPRSKLRVYEIDGDYIGLEYIPQGGRIGGPRYKITAKYYIPD